MSDADALLGRQSGCHKSVWETVHGEAHDRKGLGTQIRPEDAYPRDTRESIPQEQADTAVVGNNRRPANLGENVDRGVQCHSTDNIR